VKGIGNCGAILCKGLKSGAKILGTNCVKEIRNFWDILCKGLKSRAKILGT
jgi:hypothetical protein